MRWHRTGGMVGTLLLMAACAGPATVSSSPVGDSPAPTLGAATRLDTIEQARKAKAADDAKRVRGRAVLPKSARRTTSAVDAPQGPAMGMSGDSTVIDAVEYWRVPLSVRQSSTWITGHQPVASNYSGSSSIQPRRGVDLTGTEWVSAPPDDWGATLSISVQTVNATSSVWRVDGIAEWLDPHPLKDDSDGPRWTVAVAGGCPAVDGYLVGVRNTGPALDTSLLPAGSPSAALVCGYGGGPAGKPFKRQVDQLLTAARARTLYDSVRAVDLSHPDGDLNCGTGPQREWVLVFSFQGRADVDV